MKLTMIMLIFSSLALGQSSLDREIYQSKKNAFMNKYIEVNAAYKAYWQSKKEIQKYDSGILQKEKDIITNKVQLENVERALTTQDELKKNLNDESELNKETVFVKSSDGFITANVNDPEHFKTPAEGDKKICLADQSRCFPFKEVDGKKVLVLNKQEVMIEFQNLKTAKSQYKKSLKDQESERDRLIKKRSHFDQQENLAEQRLDEKKQSLSDFIIDNKSGVNEAFVDEVVKEAGKENIFGSEGIEAQDENTKAQMMNALDKKVFGKDSYGLLLDKADEYLKADKLYDDLTKNVKEMQTKYGVDAPSLAVVNKPLFVFPDPLFIKTFPAEAQKNSAATLSHFEKMGYPIVIEGKLGPGRSVASDLEDQPLAIQKEAGPTSLPVAGKEGEGVCKEGDVDCANPVADEVASGESPEDLCRKEAVAKLLELFKDDKQNILGKQFNLTAMKTALYLKGKVAPGSVPESMEQIINKEQANLARENAVVELKKIYKEHGLEQAGTGMDELVSKMKQGEFNYFAAKSRMTNDEASKLYMLLSKSDSDIKFGMEDSAVAWAFGQMNKFERGTSQYNKLSLSTQVNRLMGPTIAGGTNMDPEALKQASQAVEKEINDAVDVSLKSISEACQNMLSENCLIAADLKHDAFAALMKTIISKQEQKLDDKALSGFHMEVKSFIGKPGDQDFLEIGKMRLRKNIPALKEEDLKQLQIAAGKTVVSRKEQRIKAEGKCYQTKYEHGAVNVTEIECE